MALAAPVPARSADPVPREHRLDPFDRLVIEIPAEVTVRRVAGVSRAVLTAEAAVHRRTALTVRDRVLRIHATGSFQTRHPVTVLVECPALGAVDQRGSGDVRVEGTGGRTLVARISGSGDMDLERLNLESLEIDLRGSGTIRAEGRSRRQAIRIDGAGSYEAQRLESEEATVALAGSGDVAVQVARRLDVELSGSGTVAYRGDPAVRQRISGAGAVERL